MNFEIEKYQVVRNFLSRDLILYIQHNCDIHETLLSARRPATEENPYPFGDPQSPISFSWYGAIHTEALLLFSNSKMSNITGKELLETYSYTRAYYNGAILKRHVDRSSCEYSATICIRKEGGDWPIFFETESGDTVSYELEPGDMIVYKGGELPHWREPYQGQRHVQVFIHYVDKHGIYGENNLYDGRPFLGAPNSIKVRDIITESWREKNKELSFRARG